MTPGLVVPYFAADEWRAANYRRTLEHLLALDWTVASGHDRAADERGLAFSPGLARNQGARYLLDVLDIAGTVDVLVFNDADTIVELDNVRRAAELAHAAPGLVFAFTEYVRLNEHELAVEHFHAPGSHGCVAISVACWEELEGYDERFEGWGFEDLELTSRAAELWPLRRVPGVATHHWHPPAGGRSEQERDIPVTLEQVQNFALWERLTTGPRAVR